jgi:hypothetical protein
MSDNLNRLVGETAAPRWAKAFVKMLADQEGEGAQLPVDEDIMTAWFTSAIMAGYDEGVAHERKAEEARKDVAYHEAEERKEQDEGASEIPRAVYDELAPPAPKRSAYHNPADG